MSDAIAASGIPVAYYNIEAPGILRSSSSYNVVVSILNAPAVCRVKICITGDGLHVERHAEVPAKSTQMLTFQVPDLEPQGEYFLEATGSGVIEFKKKIKLSCAQSKPLVYMQLDKQAYKREDKLDFRVIFLDTNLRPAQVEQPLKIGIKYAETIVAEFKDIKLTKGVYIGHWQIPKNVNTGDYTLQAYLSNDAVATKKFEVIDYVPPTFNIVIKGLKEVPLKEGQFNIAVEAHHPDGTPVQGLCTVTIKVVAGYYAPGARPIKKSMHINGVAENFIFDFREDLCIEENFQQKDYFYSISYKLQAVVQQADTKREEQITEMLVIKKKHVEEENCISCCSKPCGEDQGPDVPAEVEEGQEENVKVKPISILPATQVYKVGDTMQFCVRFTQVTDYFVYSVIARGNIVENRLVQLEDHKLPYTIKVQATMDFVPRAFLLVYFVHNGQLYFDEMGFNMSQAFEYQLELAAPSSAAVGDTIQIGIKSAPHSLVGLMAVDENSVMHNATNELDEQQIFKDLKYVRSQTPWLDGYGVYPGLKAGLITLTNATWNGFIKGDPDGKSQKFSDREHASFVFPNYFLDLHRDKNLLLRELQERKQVFGNWFFENVEIDELGEGKLAKKLPTQATTWLVTAFSMNSRTGFATSKSPIKIKANSSTSSDSNELPSTQKITTKVINFEVHHYDDGEYRKTIELPFVTTAIVAVEFTISTNLLGPTIATLEQYAGTIYGSGYLHMTTFIPNVVVLEYLESVQQLQTELALDIKRRLLEAIANEVAVRRDDYSFCWFNKNDTGSPHVTAMVLQAFQRAAKYVKVDVTVIEQSLAYLASLQTAAGDFTKEVKPYKEPFQADTNVGMTAQILLTFLQSAKATTQYQPIIDQALVYIENNLEHVNNIYDLAVTFYAMQLVRHPSASQLKDRLFKLACRDATKNIIWWTYTGAPSEEGNNHRVYGIEITAYALLALLETEPVQELLPIVKYLLPYGKPFGEAANETMDCALGLDAILKFAVKTGAPSGVTRVKYTAFTNTQELQGNVDLNANNSLNITTQLLPKDTLKVEFSTSDKGSFIGKITVRSKRE